MENHKSHRGKIFRKGYHFPLLMTGQKIKNNYYESMWMGNIFVMGYIIKLNYYKRFLAIYAW